MFKRYIKPKANEDKVFQLGDISAEGRVRLLDMAFSRLRFGLLTMPIISAVFAWYYHFSNTSYRVIIWSFCYFCAGIASVYIYKIYKKNQQTLSADNMLRIWLPRIHVIVIVHSIGLMLLLPMVAKTATIEFKYLFILTLTAIMSANATHQSPMLSVFNRLLTFGWHGTVLLMPLSFYDHWQFIMPLSAIYSVAMHRHSLKTHHFFVRMIWLEEEGSRLAENYKAAKESAESALKAKNQFLTTASHDLRQPVHAMGFLIESIARRNQDSSLVPALKDLKQSVRSVTQMFNSLLDLSKIESGNVKLQTGNVYLSTLIQDIATVFAEEARSRDLEIRVRTNKTDAIVIADGILLRQSIMNLMHNALRYTKQGGVVIAVRKRGNDWQLEVWDTGIGVAIEDQARIYSPFYRNEHAWRIDSAGHGLGLAVVARCCDLMDCQYGFSSRLGRGSRFWLRLPAVTGRLQSIRIINESKHLESWAIQTSLSGTCLIVDDDPQVTSAWQSLLSSWGLDVRCVESATQAFAALDEGFMPQVILCDQRLRAGESGFDVLRALLERCPKARGAMVSGEFDSPELIEAENEGYLVLHKPLEPEALFTVLSRWLAKSEKIVQKTI
jgi:signal transduction histidine kinase/ActR/RegA family two-component response regulator